MTDKLQILGQPDGKTHVIHMRGESFTVVFDKNTGKCEMSIVEDTPDFITKNPIKFLSWLASKIHGHYENNDFKPLN